MLLKQINMTGHRIIGSIAPLGKLSPKHHGIILGVNPKDNQEYVAESMNFGYRLSTKNEFIKRYVGNGSIKIKENDGNFSNATVAQRALNEINHGGDGNYNLINNNCESFSNRAMYGHSRSGQITNVAIGLTAIVAGVGIYWFNKRAKEDKQAGKNI